MQTYRRVVVPPAKSTVEGNSRGASEHVAMRIHEVGLASVRDSDRWAVATRVGTDASGTLLLEIEVTSIDDGRGWTCDPALPPGRRSVGYRYLIRDAATRKAMLPVQEVWSSGGGVRSDSGPRQWDWTAAFLAQGIVADLGLPLPRESAKSPQ